LGLLLSLYVSQAVAVESDLSREELQTLLKERDAAIIQLQHALNNVLVRLDNVERSISPASPESTSPAKPADSDAAQTASAQGFATLEVDPQTAERALERTLVQGGALLLPTWQMEFGPSLSYSLNQFDFPALISDGGEVLLGSSEVERTVFTTNLDVRIGLPFDSQFELGLPYRWADEETRTRILGAPFGQTDNRSGNGVGSLRVGLAKTFVRERGWRPDVVGRLTWDTGSGDRVDNDIFLGGGFESISASLTFIKRSDPMVFLGSVSYETFDEDNDVEPGDQFAFSAGTALAVSPSSSLFATVSNQFLSETDVAGDRIDGSDITAVSLNLGASTIVARGILLNLTTGIGVSDDAPDYSIGLSASVRTNVVRRLLDR
jgi:hypothetical protein